ncbi:hypothetical protein VP01_15g4 [Puccinia sorghi]|uniref:Uncharacterized protein n=1 Tax=Puccinia sorghi TaxID=27349 RepID=A0A0L6VJ67_9BASI|nr:hypothetical protein VP01_15g4 [Puccinia sorghi]
MREGTTASSLPPPLGTVPSSVPPDTNVATQENTKDSDEDQVKINIEYLFFFKEEKKTKQQTNSLPSNRGKLSLMWSANNPSLSQFKLAAIEEIRFRDAVEFCLHAEQLNNSGFIKQTAVIPHGGQFVANQKDTGNQQSPCRVLGGVPFGERQSHNLID